MTGEGRPGEGACPGALVAGERWFQHLAFLLVAASGLLLAWCKYLSPAPDDPFQAIGHPLQPHALHAHVLAAPLLLVALGLILRDHILARLRRRAHRGGRRSGALAAVLLMPMVASGYLLQTATGEGTRRLLVWVHAGTGAVYAAAFLAHVAAGRWAARRNARLRRAMRLAGSPEGVRLRREAPARRADRALTP